MKLVYPACFYPCEEGGFTVIVPDLPGCVTEGDTLSDAVDMAVDAASGWLLDSVENNEPIPQASEIKTVIADEYENGFVSLISIDLDDYSKQYGNKAVKKTLTIPNWLNTMAEHAGINFSQELQERLKERLLPQP
ncbi:MAG: type II toxin-antitoxin system HicB family antitoxin [bacterium]